MKTYKIKINIEDNQLNIPVKWVDNNIINGQYVTVNNIVFFRDGNDLISHEVAASLAILRDMCKLLNKDLDDCITITAEC